MPQRCQGCVRAAVSGGPTFEVEVDPNRPHTSGRCRRMNCGRNRDDPAGRLVRPESARDEGQFSIIDDLNELVVPVV